jgi:hypothetical protein
MYDCDSILNQLSDYLDGQAPDTDVNALRQQARSDRNCLSAFEAMLHVHALFSAAPVAASTRDFSVSVTRELMWRQRRDMALLGGILLMGVLTLIAPLLILIWVGVATMVQPGLWQSVVSWAVNGIGQLASYGVALMNLLQHTPDWAIISFSTFVSLSFLLLALAAVMQKAPEQLFTSAELNRKTT